MSSVAGRRFDSRPAEKVTPDAMRSRARPESHRGPINSRPSVSLGQKTRLHFWCVEPRGTTGWKAGRDRAQESSLFRFGFSGPGL
ncbi:hypothetical protein HPP92_014655 [Vanilla planifolia]|uniref:Uncharacterized protein n=1 Tax=Vanilla planifolia TaxID=51239 RepID=A0A835QJR2_VANPL|nr:hypothetical protein HPP92_014655 [Vanilla planifolia]